MDCRDGQDEDEQRTGHAESIAKVKGCILPVQLEFRQQEFVCVGLEEGEGFRRRKGCVDGGGGGTLRPRRNHLDDLRSTEEREVGRNGGGGEDDTGGKGTTAATTEGRTSRPLGTRIVDGSSGQADPGLVRPTLGP